MNSYGFKRAVVALCVVGASQMAQAQGRAPTPPPSSGNPKFDALVRELRPYVPNHGTLTLARGDTLVYSVVLTGTRRIPLANVELLAAPDSFLVGFRCIGGQQCIVFEPPALAKSHEAESIEEVIWHIGSVRRSPDRVTVFQGDPGPFKRVADAVTALLADQPHVRSTDRGSISATSAAELNARKAAIDLLNSPASRWTMIVDDSAIKVGVDLKNVQRENGYRLTWLKTTFNPAADLPEGSVSMVIAQQRFDCQRKRTQVLRTVLALSGQVVTRGQNPGDKWVSVADNPSRLGVLERVCATPP